VQLPFIDGQMLQDNAVVNTGCLTEFYEKVHSAKTPVDLCTHLEKIITSFGFLTYSVIYIPDADEINFYPYIVATNWPKVLLKESNRHKLVEKNQIVASLRSRLAPLTFDLDAMTLDSKEIGALSKAQQSMINLLREHNRIRGAYFPCVDSRGQKGAISVSGLRDLPSADETSILHLISHFAFSHMHFLMSPNASKAGLTSREEDCLNWTARGKTNSECSTILGISENTVAGYIASISRKLSARNKAHMIALAYESGLLNRHGRVQPALHAAVPSVPPGTSSGERQRN
jgi:DNA-binding CsgD family transcriptional regulator